jgi:uncharacterized paraquat-inducible protein A
MSGEMWKTITCPSCGYTYTVKNDLYNITDTKCPRCGMIEDRKLNAGNFVAVGIIITFFFGGLGALVYTASPIFAYTCFIAAPILVPIFMYLTYIAEKQTRKRIKEENMRTAERIKIKRIEAEKARVEEEEREFKEKWRIHQLMQKKDLTEVEFKQIHNYKKAPSGKWGDITHYYYCC